jgi:pimeloyl-ACP methyl ester carboxylesterase
MVFERRGRSSELVVLLHAYTSSPSHLAHVRRVATSARPDADVLVPKLSAGVFSLADPVEIACDVLGTIDHAWARRLESGTAYERLVLVGHSLGALLARKVYVFACGENADAPFERYPSAETAQPRHLSPAPRPWASRVERVILLAGMNRGWTISHHMSLVRAITWRIGTVLGGAIAAVSGRSPLIFTIRRGAPFLTELRLQSISMRQHIADKGVGGALTIQLLGSVDDMVSPEDNIDLVAGSDFFYLDVPHSGHANVIQMDDTPAGEARAALFRRALVGSEDELERARVRPADLPLPARREEITDVVFVIHGIRDLGYWTHKIARRVQALGRAARRVVETETSSYGYFPMLSFLLPGRRREKVEWLMDQYAEAKALYPNAAFSFVGHSNGTYLVARALRDYPGCRFRHVVFAGSVVRTDYDWGSVIAAGRVRAVLNYVATADWVVALFPKGIEMLGLQDLGSAGHDGFATRDLQAVHEIQYVHGAHSAALAEENWDAIARFVLDGTAVRPPQPLDAPRRQLAIEVLGRLAPLIWVLIAALLVATGWAIATSGAPEWLRTVVLMLYLFAIYKVLTRL